MAELVELYRKNKHTLLTRGVGRPRQESVFLRGLVNFTWPWEAVRRVIFQFAFSRPLMSYSI